MLVRLREVPRHCWGTLPNKCFLRQFTQRSSRRILVHRRQLTLQSGKTELPFCHHFEVPPAVSILLRTCIVAAVVLCNTLVTTRLLANTKVHHRYHKSMLLLHPFLLKTPVTSLSKAHTLTANPFSLQMLSLPICCTFSWAVEIHHLITQHLVKSVKWRCYGLDDPGFDG